MLTKVMFWAVVGLIGLYLVLRPFTPPWADALAIAMALPMFVWLRFLAKRKTKDDASDPSKEEHASE